MNFGFTHSNTNAPNQTVNAFQSRDQLQGAMGFKGVQATHNTRQPLQTRETFDLKTIKMPKMEVRNAPNHPVFSAKGGH